MSGWTWSPRAGRLICVEHSPSHTLVTPTITLDSEEMGEEQDQGPLFPPSLASRRLN